MQVLRSVFAFDGAILVCDPSAKKRALAQELGGVAVAPAELQDAVLAHSGGRRAEYLVDAVGLNKIQGLPFKVSEIVKRINRMLEA